MSIQLCHIALPKDYTQKQTICSKWRGCPTLTAQIDFDALTQGTGTLQGEMRGGQVLYG